MSSGVFVENSQCLLINANDDLRMLRAFLSALSTHPIENDSCWFKVPLLLKNRPYEIIKFLLTLSEHGHVAWRIQPCSCIRHHTRFVFARKTLRWMLTKHLHASNWYCELYHALTYRLIACWVETFVKEWCHWASYIILSAVCAHRSEVSEELITILNGLGGKTLAKL